MVMIGDCINARPGIRIAPKVTNNAVVQYAANFDIFSDDKVATDPDTVQANKVVNKIGSAGKTLS